MKKENEKMSKGQMFIILALVIAVVLVLIKNSINITTLLENRRFMESGMERLEFDNVKKEIIMSMKISPSQTNSSNNSINMMSFVKSSFSSRSVDFSLLTVESSYPTVVSGVSTRLNITGVNLLGEDILSMNITFSYDSSTKNLGSIKDTSKFDTYFDFSTTSDQNYTLTVSYSTPSINSTESITIPVVIGKSKFIAFVDMKTVSIRQTLRDKFTETFDLS